MESQTTTTTRWVVRYDQWRVVGFPQGEWAMTTGEEYFGTLEDAIKFRDYLRARPPVPERPEGDPDVIHQTIVTTDVKVKVEP